MFNFFFFNDTATTEIYTLSLHDALPISRHARSRWQEVRHRLHQDRLYRFFRPWRPGVALEEDPRAGWRPPALRLERRSPDAVRADQVGHALRDRENARGGEIGRAHV